MSTHVCAHAHAQIYCKELVYVVIEADKFSNLQLAN